MNIDTVDTLVLDWLIRSGYQRTFHKLPASSSESLKNAANSLSFRAGVVGLIREGRILEAIEEIGGRRFAETQIALNEVLFLLRLQHFIELIRQRNTTSALTWIQTSVMPSVTPVFEPVLQDYLGILAYADPETSPLSYFFERTERYANLAQIVNAALYNLTSEDSSEPPIEILLKQVQAVDQLVYELGGFSNDIDDRKWSAIQHLINQSDDKQTKKNFIKAIKND